MALDLPTIGTRISHTGFLGTVRYVGSVDGTHGIWLGIEWDDLKRGKHDGVKDGKRYFTCLVPNSGSFIRPTAVLSYGVSFLSALTAKYIELPRGSSSQEKVILGSSGGAIEVEAVGLDRIRGNLSRLEKLREVSLDNELVSEEDPPGEIERTCPGIRGLDLSKNLISNWATVSAITVELQGLRSLSLNQNRFRPLIDSRLNPAAFQRLEELQLSATMTTWSEFQSLLPYMPVLRTTELGYNRLRALSAERPSKIAGDPNPMLQSLNFDGNELHDFADLSAALHNLPGLKRLILTSNCMAKVHVPPSTDPTSGGPGISSHLALSGVQHLALAFNRLASWSDIDILQRWFPVLESLTMAGNPLLDDPAHAKYARAFIIAKIPSLTSLDGAAITSRERTDSELLYLSHIAKQVFLSDDEKRAAHPQWGALSSKHGVAEDESRVIVDAQDTLSNRLISIRIYNTKTTPPASLPPSSEYLSSATTSSQPFRVLSSMSVRTLRLKLLKAFKVPKAQHAAARIWMVLPAGQCVELTDDLAGRDLAYLGVDEDTRIVLVVDG